MNNDNQNKLSTVTSNQETQYLNNNEADFSREDPTQSFVQVSHDQLTSEQSFITTTSKEGEIPSPSISTNPNSNKNSLFKKIFIGIFVSFLILFIVGMTAIYILAYEKITLSQFPEFQKKVSFFAMDYLPFAPKSAQYLLYKAVLANGEYSSYAFDISMAFSFSNLTAPNIFGFPNYDFLAKGSIDYSDKDNLISSVNISFSKNTNIDLILKDKMLYFKINSVPPSTLSMIGLNSEKFSPFVNTWISQDTNALRSNAREFLEESQNNNQILLTTERLVRIFDDTIAKEIKVEKIEKEGSIIYKLTLSPSRESLRKILTELIREISSRNENYDSEFEDGASELSEIIKDMRIEVWLDANTFYLKRVSSEFSVKSESGLNENILNMGLLGLGINQFLDMKVATVAKFSEFGKKVEVFAPTNAITFEEFFMNLLEIYYMYYVQDQVTNLEVRNLDNSRQYNNFEQLSQP